MQIRALFFVLVSLFFFDFVYARKREHSTLDSKRAGRRNPTSTTDPDVLTSRQYHAPRALLDVCVYLDVDVLAGLNLLGIPLDAALGTDICLCLSALPVLLKTNIHLGALVSAFGTDIVTTELNAIVSLVSGLASSPI